MSRLISIVDMAYRAFPDLPEARVKHLAITRLCQGCSVKDAGQETTTGHTHPAIITAEDTSCNGTVRKNKEQMPTSLDLKVGKGIAIFRQRKNMVHVVIKWDKVQVWGRGATTVL